MPDDFAFVFTKQRIYVSVGRVANSNTGFFKIFTNQSNENIYSTVFTCDRKNVLSTIRLNNSDLFVLI